MPEVGSRRSEVRYLQEAAARSQQARRPAIKISKLRLFITTLKIITSMATQARVPD